MLIVQPQNREDSALLTRLIYKPTVSVYTNNIELSSFLKRNFISDPEEMAQYIYYIEIGNTKTIHCRLLDPEWGYQFLAIRCLGRNLEVFSRK